LAVDIHARNNFGKTAFMLANRRKHAAITNLLLAVDVNKQFVLACQKGERCAVENLLALQKEDGSLLIDVNAKNDRGDSALTWACTNGHANVVEKLLSLKKTDGSLLVDVNAEDKQGQGSTALKRALIGDHISIAKQLLIAGAKASHLASVLRQKLDSSQKKLAKIRTEADEFFSDSEACSSLEESFLKQTEDDLYQDERSTNGIERLLEGTTQEDKSLVGQKRNKRVTFVEHC